jgi:hypothetical protein
MRSTIIFALLAAALLMPAVAYAQERGPTREEIIEAEFSGPVFLDAYWTTGSSGNQTGAEVDVGPGDGASTLAVVLINRGPSDIAGITGRLSLPGDFQATGRTEGSAAVATFNQIAEVGSPFTLFFDVDVLDSANVGEYTAQLAIDYSRIFESGTPRSKDLDVQFRVTGDAVLVLSRIAAENQSSTQIAAGKIEDYAFSVANSGTAPITNVIITLESQSESLEILGDSKWDIQRINQDSQAELSTQVFAANSLIGSPASFDVIVEYSSNGQPNTERFTLGTYVAGEISITAYEIEINYIGGAPNIVGNLLNEGNTVALFTTIEVVSADGLVSSLPPSQYLGDLEENSPLPFSIPVNIDSGAGAGTYPVSLQVTYKDNLRELHSFDVDAEVEFVPEQSADESGQDNSMALAMPVGIGAAIAIAIGVGVALRRRKKASVRRTIQAGKQDEDIESVLDSHSRKDDRR